MKLSALLFAGLLAFGANVAFAQDATPAKTDAPAASTAKPMAKHHHKKMHHKKMHHKKMHKHHHKAAAAKTDGGMDATPAK